MKFFNSFDGTVIHYTENGVGTPIIFIHPPLLTLENFYYQIKGLRKQFRVITFDIRGHGYSDFSNEPISYPLIVKDVLCLMDFLKIKKAFLCGYSTGGSIVIEGMFSNPDRITGSILVSTQSDASNWFLRSEIKMAVSFCNGIRSKLLSYSIIKGNSNNKLTFNRLHQSALLGNIDCWKQYFEASLHFNRTNELPDIHTPCLLIYGEKNKSFHQYAKKIKKGLQNSQLNWIKGARHQIPTKNAIEMNTLITDWISKLVKIKMNESS